MAKQNGVPAVLGGGGAYIRTTVAKTTNGLLPETINGVVQTEETFWPMTAKKHIERKNARIAKTFPHLVAKIEVVGG